MRGIRGVGGIKIEKPGMGGVTRSVAIPIGEIGRGTTRGELFAARRLRELPHSGVRDAAGGWERRILRDSASGRGRTGVVVDPVSEVALTDVVPDVVGCDDRDPPAFIDEHTRTIDASAITRVR